MPLFCFSISQIFKLDTELAIGLIIIGYCPGCMNSNIIFFVIGTDISLSVACTSVSSVIAVIALPCNLFGYIEILKNLSDDAGNVKIDYTALAFSNVSLLLGK